MMRLGETVRVVSAWVPGSHASVPEEASWREGKEGSHSSEFLGKDLRLSLESSNWPSYIQYQEQMFWILIVHRHWIERWIASEARGSKPAVAHLWLRHPPGW